MPTKKIPIDKPLTPRLQNEHRLLQAIVGSLAVQILNATDGEVWRAAVRAAKEANDAFYAERAA